MQQIIFTERSRTSMRLTPLDAQLIPFVERKTPYEPNFIKHPEKGDAGNFGGKPSVHRSSPRRRSRPTRHHLGLTPSLDSTYRRIRRAIATCNGCCDWSIPRLAAFVGISPRQLQRDVRVLVGRGLIVKIKRAGKVYGNESNLWKLPQIQVPPPGDKHVTQRQVLLNAGSTSANAPVLPRAREEAPGFPPAAGSPSEPPTPANPPATAWDRAKQERKPRRGQWSRRSASVARQLTPVQRAAERVMVALGVALSGWGTRDAIASAVCLWIERNPTQGLDEAVNAMVACWQSYEAADVRFHRGKWSFFGEGYWQKRESWGWKRRSEAQERMARDLYTQSQRQLAPEDLAEFEERERDAQAHEAAGERWSNIHNGWIRAENVNK